MRSQFLTHLLALGFVIFVLFLPVSAQTSGTYPAEPFNGMQITYSISGAFISKVTDTPGFTTRRALEGSLGNGGELRVTGKATMDSGYGADVIVTVQASGEAKTFQKYIKAGESIEFNLAAPIGPVLQQGSVRIVMTGSYNVGTRGLQVAAYLGTKKPNVIDTKPTPPPLSANARLNEILNRYISTIPKGYTGLGGNLVNIGSSIPFTSRFDNWVCGAYQAHVLAFLDSIKWNPDPKVRALLDGFDYGPVEAPGMLWTLFPHQAVVIYPKGSDWITDGIVLDPWMTQTPKSYTTAEWAQMHSYGSYWGIRGSSVYEGKPEYPTVGGNYVNPGQRALTSEEKQWAASLPQVDKDKLKTISDPNLRTLLIRNGYKQRKLTGVAIVNCPVNVSLVDGAGKTVGYTSRGYVGEIGGATVERIQKGAGDWWTLVRFDPDKRLRLRLTATGAGAVEVITAHGMDRDERIAARYLARVQAGERLENDTTAPRQPLTGAGRTYQAATLTKPGTEGAAPLLIGGKTTWGTIYPPNVKGDPFAGGNWVNAQNGSDWLQRDFDGLYSLTEIRIVSAGTDVTTKGSRMLLKLQQANGQWITVDELRETNINMEKLSFGGIGNSIPTYRKVLSVPITAKAFRLELYGNGWFSASDIKLIGKRM